MNKYVKYSVIYLVLALFLTGCSSTELNKPEDVSKAVEQIVKTTEQVIADKDLKSARTLWGKISEYGVKAGELGYQELSQTLGKLASTYDNLVQYLETGDEAQLKIFRQNFTQTMEELKKAAKTE